MISAKWMFAGFPSPTPISADPVFCISEKADRVSRQRRQIATTMGDGWRGLPYYREVCKSRKGYFDRLSTTLEYIDAQKP